MDGDSAGPAECARGGGVSDTAKTAVQWNAEHGVTTSSYTVWDNVPEGGKVQSLTMESLKSAIAKVKAMADKPIVEYHHPMCPKFVTSGRMTCRCGASPGESMFLYGPGNF